MVNPRYLMPVLAVVFLALAFLRLLQKSGRFDPRSKSWLIAGILFAFVSAWLWWSA